MTLSECITDKPLMMVGYTTRQHLLLDLDATIRSKAFGLAKHVIHSYPEVGDCLLVVSSIQEEEYGTRINRKGIPKHNFRRDYIHLVFDNIIGYKRCCDIINTLVDLNVLESAYRKIRSFRGDMTIRISPMVLSDYVKEQPKPLIYIGNRHNSTSDYKILDYKKLWWGCGRFFLSNNHTKDKTHNTAYTTYYACCNDSIETNM